MAPLNARASSRSGTSLPAADLLSATKGATAVVDIDVNAVTGDGALYFGSAGNEGNVIDGTSGNYEGDFVSSGKSVGTFAGVAQDFDPGPGVQVF